MNAYSKLYLDDARNNLAFTFDYAVNNMGVDFSELYYEFCNSSFATAYDAGDARTLAGMSGIEIALRLVQDKKLKHNAPKIMHAQERRSKEFWVGWALAYYHWQSGIKFNKIASFVSPNELLQMYSKYHEMGISHFCDNLDRLKKLRCPNSALKELRLSLGISQSKLADMSGVPLRTLQQYEQGQKDINKAQAQYVIALAKALGCHPSKMLS